MDRFLDDIFLVSVSLAWFRFSTAVSKIQDLRPLERLPSVCFARQ